jgi:hypothetical protein
MSDASSRNRSGLAMLDSLPGASCRYPETLSHTRGKYRGPLAVANMERCPGGLKLPL